MGGKWWLIFITFLVCFRRFVVVIACFTFAHLGASIYFLPTFGGVGMGRYSNFGFGLSLSVSILMWMNNWANLSLGIGSNWQSDIWRSNILSSQFFLLDIIRCIHLPAFMMALLFYFGKMN